MNDYPDSVASSLESGIALSATARLNEPWLTAWPVAELEEVEACPVCKSRDRALITDQLVDNVFFVAHGRWSLFSCTRCKGAYLDPRPTRASIGKAYGTYYTHVPSENGTSVDQLHGLRRLRRILVNGYLNYRYGTQYLPANHLGIFAALFQPTWRRAVAVQFRYMPKPKHGQRLLDIGCGNGDFLYDAQRAGWDVMGLDLDPKAAAIQRGFNVKIGTIDQFSNESECFDAITLNHVIEHVHEPEHMLSTIYRLLKPGGIVYIETPNAESLGARIFGKNWRGYESPRHLVLLSVSGLSDLLANIGFKKVHHKRRTEVTSFLFLSSLRMQAGMSPYGPEHLTLPWFLKLRMKFQLPFMSKTALELITLTAVKDKA